MNVELLAVDPNNADHRTFLLNILKEVGDFWLEDHRKDPLLTLNKILSLQNQEVPVSFFSIVDGEPAGFITSVVDNIDNAYIEGGALKKFQRFFPAVQTLSQYCHYLFDEVEVRKCKMSIALSRKGNIPAEIVARKIGFKKEGQAKKEMLVNGRYYDALNLYLFREDLKG